MKTKQELEEFKQEICKECEKVGYCYECDYITLNEDCWFNENNMGYPYLWGFGRKGE